VNPQQGEYAWGSAELVAWKSLDGQPLQGIVYKPAGFDPRKRYPMVVYFYESLSDNLHQYHAPFGRNTINPTVYASNGYVVFFPDVAYANGYPGQSALKSIMPGIQAVAARGYVDERRVGVAGQSWGGYQGAYMITQTPYFRAAFLGAPVANMTSAYGGIRWESGVARAFQYEKDAEPHRAARCGTRCRATSRTRRCSRRPGDDADAHHEQRRRRRGAVVPGDRAVRRARALRQGGVPAQLQRRRPQPAQARQPARRRPADAAVLRAPPQGRAGARLDARGRAVPSQGRDQLAPAATVAGGEAGAPNAPAAGGPPAAPSGAPGGGAPGGSRGAGAGTP
jgi:hypothetical protein